MNIRTISSFALIAAILFLTQSAVFANEHEDAKTRPDATVVPVEPVERQQTKPEARSAPGETMIADRALNDAWMRGKVEMAILLNRYLNGFEIQTQVSDGQVLLSGRVQNDIDRDLAEQIALGIDGVESVKNELVVDPEETGIAQADDGDQLKLFQRIEDMTTTARIKSKLVLNNNIKGRRINVDTRNGVVTLNGNVTDPQERDLAVQIARNTSYVTAVLDEIEVNEKTVTSAN